MQHKKAKHLGTLGVSILVSIIATISLIPAVKGGIKFVDDIWKTINTNPNTLTAPAKPGEFGSCSDVIHTMQDAWVYEMAERRIMGLPQMSYEEYLAFDEERNRLFTEEQDQSY